ncbi:MAG: asparagine synthase (glutamine-hydrolyzing) [Candidatus Hydrogenedentota bacterium]|nr:MAG: asparagine synthase (glutamine-hydrolyzing) [Candidatus Hydrogenedentota bacterium]
MRFRGGFLMCGIAGILHPDPGIRKAIEAMTEALVHRGPDDRGVIDTGEVALGHRRLSIVDLSEKGRQPLRNESGEVLLVCNGEIYDFETVRRGLEKREHRFHSRSDSEVLVHLFEEEGERCFATLNGMFACAVWDGPRRRLVLARDRMGQKPLYYAMLSDGGIAFASELKSLLRVPGLAKEIDRKALAQYLALGYVAAPRTIYSRIRKLPPGCVGIFHEGKFRVSRYFHPEISERRPWSSSVSEWEEELRCLLTGAVKRRLVADVEVGVWLSGGIDSSLLGLLAAENCDSLRTFSVSFTEKAFDESEYARFVARTLRTEHHELTCTPADLIETIPKVLKTFDEPFADASAVPTYLLSRHTSRFVKVALSGDGADELFGGYPTLWAQTAAQRLAVFRRALPQLAPIAERLPQGDGYYPPSYVLARFLRHCAKPPVERQVGWTAYVEPELLAELFPEAREWSAEPAAFQFEKEEREEGGETRREQGPFRTAGVAAVSRLLDQMRYLPDDILVKTDRSSMAHSLEVRAPFLDPSVVAFANRLPDPLVTKKVLLKRLLRSTCLAPISRRGKQGFAVPLAKWFREDLRENVAAMLGETETFGLEGAVARRIWNEHQQGRANRWREIWALYVLGCWKESAFKG